MSISNCHAFKRKLLPATIALLLQAGFHAHANPTGANVVAGQAQFAHQGNDLTVTNSNGAVINWQSFSIAPGETTRFNQASADSLVLNKVVGADPSQLMGTLQSNGKVFVINPAGVLVGEGAKIDVAGFVASNLNLNQEPTAPGSLHFQAAATTTGKVANYGEIHTPTGGQVYLVGTEVSNHGLIQSPQGAVILAAGQTVQLHDTGTPGVSVEITGDSNQAINLGQIVAQSGQVGMVGAVVKNSGVINANQLVEDGSGRIFFKAKHDVTLASGSQLTANADAAMGEQAKAGSIRLQAEQGAISIETQTLTAANGPNGGQIALQANQSTIDIAGEIEAQGTQHAGGEIVANASTLRLQASAKLNVSGQHQGGLIQLSAHQNSLQQAGQLDAQGQQQNGGLIQLQAATQLDNTGALHVAGQTQGGRVALQADTINQAGLIHADGQIDGGGIALTAVTELQQRASGQLSAQGRQGQGGQIAIASRVSSASSQRPLDPPQPTPTPSQVLMLGTLNVSGRRGGSIHITGERVGLLDNAHLLANGATDGGDILIGGDYQGQNPAIPNAQASYVARSVLIEANGGAVVEQPLADGLGAGVGNGGKIIVWSDQATRVYATLHANGGIHGGDGGFIETSGHWLDTHGIRIEATAALGKAGSWLLDPNDVMIQASGNDSFVTGNPVWTTTDGYAILTTATIQSALNIGTSVTVSTASAGTTNYQFGDITVASPIIKTAGGDAKLTLNAHNNININASITSNVGKLDMDFNPDSDTSGSGQVTLANGASITFESNGGVINFLKKVGLSSGDVHFGEFVSLSQINIDDLIQTGGVIWNAKEVNISGSGSSLSGGVLGGSGGGYNLLNGAVLSAHGFSFESVVFNIRSGATAIFDGNIGFSSVYSASYFNNAGTLNLDGAYQMSLSQFNDGGINNTGTINKIGQGIYNIDNFSLVNDGVIHVSGGGLQITPSVGGVTSHGQLSIDDNCSFAVETGGSNGYSTFTSTSTISGLGEFVLGDYTITTVDGGLNINKITLGYGTLNLNSDATVSLITQTSGGININKTLALSVLNQTFGSISGTGTLNLSGLGSLTTGPLKIGTLNLLSGATLSSMSIEFYKTNATFTIQSGATADVGSMGLDANTESLAINNAGTLNLTDTCQNCSGAISGGGKTTINNSGIINAALTNDYNLHDVVLNNSGIIHILGNWLRTFGSSTVTHSGQLIVDALSKYESSSVLATHTFTASSSVTGSGWLYANGATFDIYTPNTNFSLSNAYVTGGNLNVYSNINLPYLHQVDGVIGGTGTLNLSGIDSYYYGGSWANGLTVNVLSSTRLYLFNNFLLTGTLSGSGIIDNNGYSFTNNGILSPGGTGTVGTLTLAGSGRLINGSTGRIQVDIGGPLAADYDVLAVNGGTTLDGGLQVSFINGFTPSIGASFDSLTVPSTYGGTLSGSFLNQTLPGGVTGAIVSNAYRLSYNGLACSGVCWDGGAGTSDWFTAANWSSDLVPSMNDIAYINSASSVSVNVNGTASIKGLITDANNNLILSGGSLAVGSSNALLNGGFSLAGGSLAGSGNYQFLGGFTFSAGAVDTTGAITVYQSGNLALPGMAVGSLTAQATGNVSLAGTISASGGGEAIRLAAAGFQNPNSARLSAPNGRWLVYSSNPADDVVGGLTPDFIQYNMAYNASTAYSGAGSGNGLIYSIAPSVSGSLIGSVGRPYNGTATASLSSANYAVTGTINGDSVVLSTPTSGNFDSKHVGSGKSVAVSGVAVSSASSASGKPVYGYALSNSAFSANIGSITPATLTIAAVSDSRPYNGGSSSLLIPGYSGLQAGDSLTGLTQAFSSPYALGTNGSTLQIAGYSLSDGNNGGNYDVITSSALGTITQAVLTASLIGSVSKIYDTTATATLTPAHYSLSGVVNGDAVSLLPVSSGLYDSAQVGSAKTVSVSGLSLTGAAAASYSLSASAISAAIGTITPATVTIGLTGSVSKVYDGTSAVLLSPSHYTLSGVLGSDAVTLSNSGIGQYNSPNVGTGKSITISGLGLSGAAAANYVLNTSSLSANIGSITPATLTASLLGPVYKRYDGTDTARLSADNYSVNGIVGSDAVSLLFPATGVYNNAAIGSGKSVTAVGLGLTGAAASNYSLAASTISAAIGEIDYGQVKWTGAAGDGAWGSALNWSNGQVPDANYDIILDAGTPLITLNSGAVFAHNISGGDAVLVAGGQLSVEGAAVFNNAFRVSGGMLTGAGTVQANAGFQWSGGTVNSVGGVTVNGPLTLTNTLGLATTLTANGPVSMAAGTLSIDGAALFNDVFSLSGGALTGKGSLLANAGFHWSGGSIATLGGATVNGPLTLTNSLNLDTSLNANGLINQSAELLLTSNGRFNTNGFANNGSLRGYGQIGVGTGVLQNNAVLAPGNSPGRLTINGNLSLAPSSNVVFELYSPNEGNFDQLQVNGIAQLGGRLTVAGLGLPGRYPVITATSLLNRFAQTDADGIPVSLQYELTGLTLASVQSPIMTTSLQMLVTASNIASSSASSAGLTATSSGSRLMSSTSSLWQGVGFFDAAMIANGPTLTDPDGSVGGGFGEFGGRSLNDSVTVANNGISRLIPKKKSSCR